MAPIYLKSHYSKGLKQSKIQGGMFMNKLKHQFLQQIFCSFCIGALILETGFLSFLPNCSYQTITYAAETTTSTMTTLFMKYVGTPITEPTTLSQQDFVVTAMYEDGSTQVINDYVFTSSLTLTKPGDYTISAYYNGKTTNCTVTYTNGTNPIFYQVTFETYGGTYIPPITSIAPGRTITLPASPQKDGYWFRGWFTDATLTNEFFSAERIKDNITLYAKWQKKENENTMDLSTNITFDTFETQLTIDLTGQSYGYHVNPTARLRNESEISAVLDSISPAASYYAFFFDVTDFTFNTDRPLKTKLSLPPNYSASNVCVYYTPDLKTIDGICQGNALDEQHYEFYAYAPGTYLVVQKSAPPTPTSTPTPVKKSINLSMSSTLKEGSKTKATLLAVNFTDEDMAQFKQTVFSWKSGNTKIAKVAQDGTITGVKPGVTTISAISADGVYSCTKKITITPKEILVKKIIVKKTSFHVKVGKSVQLHASVSPSNSTKKALKYTSSNKKIAKISASGKVTGIKKGSCTITIKTTDKSKLSKKVKIIVSK